VTAPAVVSVRLADPEATEAAGAGLGRAWLDVASAGAVVTLEGELGAGKTTLMRGLLRALGERGPVRSPTYTLIESYRLPAGLAVHHLDCYRIDGWQAVEELGLRDLLAPGALVAIEWASRAEGLVASADLNLELAVDGDGRRLSARARSACGEAWLAHWAVPAPVGR
jgi:tRNA threonylcarbamoyladenosine biosynthesis protein TsaE